MGAIFGHIIWSAVMGTNYDISMMSFFGFLACSGVVVNDNLVLLQRINDLQDKGYNAFESVLNASTDRFRPIVLTSLTTFAGLLPILFERSAQAQFLIPMVISLAFGVLFASVVTLVMVPCAYVGGHSVGQRIKHLNGWAMNKLEMSAPSVDIKPNTVSEKKTS
jgi:multidrug efflux pump subunit AcrB